MIIKNLSSGEWRLRAIGEDDWLSAEVPGEVHVTLLKAGRIPDPFVADNELDVQWVAEKDWEYEGRFDISKEMLAQEQVFLVCDGLDTLAEITVNGQALGSTDNAFRTYRWDIKKAIKAGENVIQIIFRSPVDYVTPLQAQQPLAAPGQSIPGGPYLRKAPCQWGWDWGPMLPPIGIWKEIRLEGYQKARMTDCHIQQAHQHDGTVVVTALASLDQWSDEGLQLCLTLTDPNGKRFATTCKVVNGQAKAVLEIQEPLLWWPNGYGEQALYDAHVTLREEDESIVDQRSYQIGLRTLSLMQDPDEFGETFTFMVNGVPIFAKGSNWIPADSFPTRITRDQLDRLLRDAARAHHNMIRVWGGGFYESEDFYDLCDAYGILVWQDFIFSCSIYPLDDPEFLENVRQEVIDNVRRIRHRASLALWCGNNEMDWGWESWGWSQGDWLAFRPAYKTFFYELLPEWLEDLDPDTPYWFSSPSSGTPFENANSNDVGDAHYWEVWHGSKPFTAYREQFPRFMSEFGFQSLPPLETIRTYATEDHWNLTDYIIEHHQRSYYASAQFMGQMALHFMMPIDFQSLVYLTMVLQAEGIRYGVEHWRRNRHRVSGTLYWQLNDCWPVASWSSLDYFGRWKALHYESKRFFAPLLLSIEDDEESAVMKVHLTSDLQTAQDVSLRWRLMRLDGKVLDEDTVNATIEPLTSQQVFDGDFSDLSLAEKRETIFVAQLYIGDVLHATQLGTFVRNKHLQLEEPQLRAYLREGSAGSVIIEVEAAHLARFVALSVDGADVVFSDNYFDVLPGETVQITCTKPEGWSLDDVGKALTVFSLYDSFA
jgi:beta-mannosidase